MRLAARILHDETGSIVCPELILVATLAVLGLLVGMASIRDALISEWSDIAGTTQELSQSYTLIGVRHHSSSVAGMAYIDQTDFCDSPDDVAGQNDNCIVFEPTIPGETFLVSTTNLVVGIDFDNGTGDDGSPGGNTNNLVARGDPQFVNGKAVLDGDDSFVLPNTNDVNLGIHQERTIVLTFNADDVSGRQVLYEEGATVRGLSIYLDNGDLYVGGWNIPGSESGWAPVFLSTSVTARNRQHRRLGAVRNRYRSAGSIDRLPEWFVFWFGSRISVVVSWWRNWNRRYQW